MEKSPFVKNVLFLLMFYILIFPITAKADKGYFHVGIGVYFPESDTFPDSNPGFAADVALGYQFHPNFAGELGVGAYNGTVGVYDLFGNKEKTSLYVVPVTLSLIALTEMEDFKPYIKAGGGCYVISFNSPASNDITMEAVLGYQIGAGVSFRGIGIEFKYLIAKESKPKIFEDGATLDPPIARYRSSSGHIEKAEFNGYVLTLTVGFD